MSEFLPDDVPVKRPPPGMTSNFVNPKSLRVTTISVGVIVQTAAVIFVGLRLIANSSGRRTLWWNDYSCILAFIFSTGATAVILYVSKLARHQYDIPLKWYDASYFKSVYSMTILLTIAMFFAKNSMFMLYLRIFSIKTTMRRMIIAGIALTIPVYWIPVVLQSYYCAPHVGPNKWNLSLAMNCSHATLYGVIQGVINVILDLYLMCLPISAIIRLQLSKRKKLGIISIFVTGSFGLAASIINMVFRAKFYRTTRDIGWSTAGLFICLMCEINVIIICSCMPSLATLSKTTFTIRPVIHSVRSRLLSPDSEKATSSSAAKTNGANLWPGSKNIGGQISDPYSESHLELSPGNEITKVLTMEQSSLSRTPC